jgi:hypothetical protein
LGVPLLAAAPAGPPAARLASAAVAPVGTAPRPAGTAARPVSPTLTDLSLGSAAVPGGKRVSTGEPDAPTVALATRKLTVSRPVTAGFSAAGVSWAAERTVGAVRVELRTRLATGRWSAWTTADVSDVEPDAGSRPGARGGTDPVWTGPSTGIEARVVPVSGSAPRDVRLTLVDPGKSAADAAPRATPAASGPTAGTLAVARPAVYTRSQWGADPALMRWDPDYPASLKAGVLHHTAGTNAYSATQVPAILRSIYAFHSRTRGWGDIGYNFLVDRFGRIWEGRYGGLDSTVIGAHTGGFNTGTVGVSMIGTFSTTAVPAATVSAVSSVFAWKLARWNLNPYGTATLTSTGGGTSRYPRGTVVRKSVLSGHRDFGYTDCPGGRGYAQLGTIRTLAARRIAAGTPRVVSPAVSPTSVPYGAATGPRVTATLTGSTAWTVTVTADCPAQQVRRWSGTGTRVDTSWDLRDSAGRAARPGTYRLTLVPNGSGTGTGYTAAVTVLPPTATPPLRTGTLPAAGPAGYVPVAATRILDTRGSLGGGAGLPLGGGRRVDVPVLGVGGVPATGVSAVLVSLTGFCSTGNAPLTLWPAGTPRRTATAISVGRGAGPWAALAAVRVGAGGRVSVAAGSGSADAALDVVGYLPLAGGSGFHPVTGSRAVDVTLAAGESREVAVTGTAVPAGAAVLLVNAAVVNPTATGELRLWAAGTERPRPANVSFAAGVTGSDRAAVPLAGGSLAMHNSSATPVRVVLDVTGWYGGAGARFTATTPTRLPPVALAAGRDGTVRVAGRAGVPATRVAAVVASLSVRPSARTWLAVWGSGARPPTADLHAEAARWETNLVVVPVGGDGRVRLHSGRSAATAVLDVVGYYR